METKICQTCGKEYERRAYTSPSEWANRKYCCGSCSSKAPKRYVKSARRYSLPESKICVQCGKEYQRPHAISNSLWMQRQCCSRQCTLEAAKAKVVIITVYLNKYCECGEENTGVVWIIQGTPEGKRHAVSIECCDDCRELWLQDGATLERQEPHNEPKRSTVSKPAYHAQAHMASWQHTKGARP